MKAPVFVTDLPPVPEPELISVQAYQAAQSSAESNTSLGSGNTPTAKITSPAAEAEANNMLVTESKLAGLIPAFGKVRGMLLNALGEPAGKAAVTAQQATAVNLVRGRILAMPALGSLYPIKQIAALLAQGMINIQIYEEMRSAYYIGF
ncbi:hypothetical protein D3C77_530090 [compost metagenome]